MWALRYGCRLPCQIRYILAAFSPGETLPWGPPRAFRSRGYNFPAHAGIPWSHMSVFLRRFVRAAALSAVCILLGAPALLAQAQGQRAAGEASLVLPDLSTVTVGGYQSRMLLMVGLGVAALGIV